MCAFCNLYKGPNLSGIDLESGSTVALFNPRTDLWQDHFQWEGSKLRGLTATGRATISVLEINQPFRVEAREWLTAEGHFLLT